MRQLSRAKKMEPLLRVAEARDLDAARTLAARRGELAEALQKLQELLTYREEYAKQLDKTERRGFGVQVQDYRLFLNRLNQAIAEQRQSLNRFQSEYEASMQKWTEARARASALGKVAERFQQADQRKDDRREQQLNDEIAARAHGRKSDTR